jgi:hypothetical protein
MNANSYLLRYFEAAGGREGRNAVCVCVCVCVYIYIGKEINYVTYT